MKSRRDRIRQWAAVTVFLICYSPDSSCFVTSLRPTCNSNQIRQTLSSSKPCFHRLPGRRRPRSSSYGESLQGERIGASVGSFLRAIKVEFDEDQTEQIESTNAAREHNDFTDENSSRSSGHKQELPSIEHKSNELVEDTFFKRNRDDDEVHQSEFHRVNGAPKSTKSAINQTFSSYYSDPVAVEDIRSFDIPKINRGSRKADNTGENVQQPDEYYFDKLLASRVANKLHSAVPFSDNDSSAAKSRIEIESDDVDSLTEHAEESIADFSTATSNHTIEDVSAATLNDTIEVMGVTEDKGAEETEAVDIEMSKLDLPITSDSPSTDDAAPDIPDTTESVSKKPSRIRRLLSLRWMKKRSDFENRNATFVDDGKITEEKQGARGLRQLTRPLRQRLSLLWSSKKASVAARNPWGRRHAKNVEEGIRREKAKETRKRRQKAIKLSSLLNRAQFDARGQVGRRYVERTLMGLFYALAEESDDLDVSINAQQNSPIWRKEIDEFRLNFSRIGFKPLRLGGTPETEDSAKLEKDELAPLMVCADEAFDLIDGDSSGALDSEEIAQALSMVSAIETDKESIEELANEIVELYDANGDGVVDREEYHHMVEDMAALQRQRMEASMTEEEENKVNPGTLLSGLKTSLNSISDGISSKVEEVKNDASGVAASVKGRFVKNEATVNDVIAEKTMGSLVLSDLKLDLRRLVFGSIPVVKHITPGGPLVLEPFTATLKGSFNREDVMNSALLDAGLRLLVARALRVRLRSFRDLVDGAVFFGRRWKMTSKCAPVVDVLELSNVEFDKNDKLVLTGRARVRTSPGAPVVTNAFKVRTKIGTRKNGQAIRLVEPELAFVFECPRSLEKGAQVLCGQLGLPTPPRPEPVYSFFPIYSPFKVNDNAGFDMGDDNRLRSIYIQDGALHFEMRAVLRPGRFLGNHYIAFTIPNRTFIVTLDRVVEGMRAARRNKQIMKQAEEEKKREEEEAEKESMLVKPASSKQTANLGIIKFFRRSKLFNSPSLKEASLKEARTNPPKSFFTRFVEGYTLVERDGEAINQQMSIAISEWFGRQRRSNSTASTNQGQTQETEG